MRELFTFQIKDDIHLPAHDPALQMAVGAVFDGIVPVSGDGFMGGELLL